MTQDMPDRIPEDLPDNMPEDMPDRMPEDMPEYMPEDMPDRIPEDLPDNMPEYMPEDMPDRMPEDLRVRKCKNVTVGITRSKVIVDIYTDSVKYCMYSYIYIYVHTTYIFLLLTQWGFWRILELDWLVQGVDPNGLPVQEAAFGSIIQCGTPQ